MPRFLQERLIPILELKKWKGVDNVTKDDTRLASGFVRVANNVDIDSDEMLHRRKGMTRNLLSTSCHSFWSDGSLAFGVLGGNLVQFSFDVTTLILSSTTLISSVGPSRMNFVPAVDRVFFSNLSMVGYIKDGLAYSFPTPTRLQRQKMIGGELIDLYNGALFAAQGGVIYSSIQGRPFETDLSKLLLPVGGPITMMNSVEDGMYVSAGSKTFFLSGPDILSFKYLGRIDVPAKKGSAITIERLDLGRGVPTAYHGVIGKAVLFHTSVGSFMGLKGGFLKDLTSAHYAEGDIEEGTAAINWKNGYGQYVFMGLAPAPMTGIKGLASLPRLEGSGRITGVEIYSSLPRLDGTGLISIP